MPDFIVQFELFTIPNDPYFNKQYYFHNTGQTGGINDADIDAPEAWNISTGSSNIIVAVVDEGIMSHPDLPASRIVVALCPLPFALHIIVSINNSCKSVKSVD
jgi:hypothetical protein